MSIMRLAPILVLIVACSGENSTGATADSRIVVTGNDMGPQSENLTLVRGGEALSGAKVTVNGTLIPETQLAGQYEGTLPAPLAPGAAIRVEIDAGADTAIGNATIPPVPDVENPIAGAAVPLGSTVAFSWASTSSPDQFLVGLLYDEDNELFVIDTVSGATRSTGVSTLVIPATAPDLIGFVIAYSDGTFTGDAHPASRMRVRQISLEVPLVLAPAGSGGQP